MKKEKFLVWLFCGLFGVGFLANVFINPPDYSQEENRYLAKMPKFSLEELFFGDYTTKLEDYIRDRFFGRNFWVGLKAGSELILQKKENNSVIFGDDGYLLEIPTLDDKQLATNIDKVETFIDNMEESGKNVHVALVPDAILAMKDKLPATYPINSLVSEVEELLNRDTLNHINLFETIDAHKDEYIYYRTDHHWTSLGSYYAYRELVTALGLTPREFSDFSRTDVSDNFLGTMFSKSGAKWSKPDSIFILEILSNRYTVTLDDAGKEYDSMFFTNHLEKKDKYSVFLDGNHALTKIQNENGNGKKILLVKDSFAHSLAPLLASDYSQVHLLDLRYYKGSVSAYMAENDILDVVLLYGATNFMTDAGLSFIR